MSSDDSYKDGDFLQGYGTLRFEFRRLSKPLFLLLFLIVFADFLPNALGFPRIDGWKGEPWERKHIVKPTIYH